MNVVRELWHAMKASNGNADLVECVLFELRFELRNAFERPLSWYWSFVTHLPSLANSHTPICRPLRKRLSECIRCKRALRAKCGGKPYLGGSKCGGVSPTWAAPSMG